MVCYYSLTGAPCKQSNITLLILHANNHTLRTHKKVQEEIQKFQEEIQKISNHSGLLLFTHWCPPANNQTSLSLSYMQEQIQTNSEKNPKKNLE